jgi:hypothetical protein
MKTGIKRRAALVLVAVLASACTGGAGDAELAKATGPPKVDLEAVARHAEQFDTQIPIRLAGSQEEEIASAYLLAHLQQAGYLVRLDAVPVRDLVNSTNVVAPPPSGADPTVVVAVAYDTARDGSSDGAVLGLWLELARALNVQMPEHTVLFVALGANRTNVVGAPLGERRLARFLADEGWEPSIIQISAELQQTALGGPAAAAIEALLPKGVKGHGLDSRCSFVLFGSGGDPGEGDCDPLGESGLDHTFVAGPTDVLGPVMLRYLSEAPS